MRRAKLLLAGLLALLLQLQGVPALQNPLLEGAHPFLTFVDDTAYLLITRQVVYGSVPLLWRLPQGMSCQACRA